MTDRCDACGREVTVAGGIANLWTMEWSKTEGMTLELEADGTEHFLCFECIEELTDDPTAADVADLGSRNDPGPDSDAEAESSS